jgi:molecular chaperone DnaK (HSP70)
MWKTPSRLAYASENANIGSENQWGYQVTAKMKSYCWTKLLLDSKAPITEYDDPDLQKAQGGGLLRLPEQCTATEVCADYLREIYNYTLDYITRRLGDAFLAVTPLEFWFTVPAIWSHQAKYATLTAARRAGFGSRQVDNIYLIPEPEAAAVATLSSWSHHGDVVVKCGDGVMICDCGGGTVDITTYVVTNMNPLQFDEAIAGIGGKCGSTYIDRNFHVWMSSQFGSAFECLGQDKTGVGSRFMKDFESSKWDFGIESDINKHFEIEITMRGVKSSKYYDADDSTVIFSRLVSIKLDRDMGRF